MRRERLKNHPPRSTRYARPPIRDWETFTAEQLADRMGISARSVGELIRQGLRFRTICRRKVISGRDYRHFVQLGDVRACEDEGECKPCQGDAA